jgi:hypothetical protein
VGATRASLADLLIGARFLSRLPWFLRHPVTHERALAILGQRFERRAGGFLSVVERAIYRNPGSPYRALLRLAGCEYGDVETLVRQHGVEESLHLLYRRGVYLSVDEFKGRRPVKRGSATLAVDVDALRNPTAGRFVPARSSGSRGPGTTADVDFDFVRDLVVNHCLALTARGGAAWQHALWHVPGSAALKRVLWLAGFGAPPVRWFSPLDPNTEELHPRYRWSLHGMRWGSLAAGVPLPRVVHAPPTDPEPIMRWMAEVLGAGGTPHLATYSSAAVRLSDAALAAGVDLHGVQITLSGEPVTRARLAAVRRTGAVAVPQYGASEAGGTIGHGCLAPSEPDDLHLFDDLRAVIQPGDGVMGNGLVPTSLLFTSLRPAAPFVLLNVSLGDRAVLARRACGCALERLGWTTHVHTIRSLEKLTVGGMNLLDADMISVLEEVMPACFGGGPADYQLVEQEEKDGHRRLRLVVHPAVGPLDAATVADAFLAAVGRRSGVEGLASLLWRESGILRVERRPPESTAGGKIIHVHVRPPAAPVGADAVP